MEAREPMKARITLSVNGETCDLLVPIHRTLLEVLREDLGDNTDFTPQHQKRMARLLVVRALRAIAGLPETHGRAEEGR